MNMFSEEEVIFLSVYIYIFLSFHIWFKKLLDTFLGLGKDSMTYWTAIGKQEDHVEAERTQDHGGI